MNFERTRFFKGLPNFTVSSDDGLLKAAEASIYKYWWMFMRLSPVYWYARQTGINPVISEIAESYEKAGNLESKNFNYWWSAHGKYVFEEAKRPAKVRIVNVDEPVLHEFYQKSIMVEIPLTISSKKIIRDIKILLREIEHDVTGSNVIKLSNAALKLKSKKFNLSTLENEYWVLVYRILYPDIPIWKIGDRLQLAPNNKVRGIEPSQFHRGQGPFSTLQSLTGRNLYKARFARYHVERGSFPNYTRVSNLDAVQPFGEKHHKEFLEATCETVQFEYDELLGHSPWQQHISNEHNEFLTQRIIQANRHRLQHTRDLRFRLQYEAFIAGTTDLL